MDITEVLGQKHASTLLLFLLERGPVTQVALLEVIPSNLTLSRLGELLERNGLIEIKREFAGRRKYTYSLTPKGRQVAEQLKRAEEAAKGKIPSTPEEESRITVETNEKGEKIYVLTEEYRREQEERRKRLSALVHVNVMDDHITFKETNYGGKGKDRILSVYVKLNHSGNLKLWCDADESFDCWHVNEAWSLPEVREMYFNQVKRGNVGE
jgi:DNA-binding MarR family transcriptional regulator